MRKSPASTAPRPRREAGRPAHLSRRSMPSSISRSPSKAWVAWRSISPAAFWIVAVNRFPTSTPWVNWLASVAPPASTPLRGELRES